MPFVPRWFGRIPDALAQLAALDRDLLTRQDLERLFGVSRARDAQLLHHFGAEPVGAQLVLRRGALIRTLTALCRGRPARAEAARRTRFVTALHRARLEAVRVTVSPAALTTQVVGFTNGPVTDVELSLLL